MKNQAPLRIIYNIVLIVIAIISIVATGFVSIYEYRCNMIPKVLSDDEVVKIVSDKSEELNADKNEIWKVESVLAEDNKSYTANVTVDKINGFYKDNYSTSMTFKLVDGAWKLEEGSLGEITKNATACRYENSEWTGSSEDETEYTVAFLNGFEAQLSIKNSTNTVPTEMSTGNDPYANGATIDEYATEVYTDSNVDGAISDAQDINTPFTCVLAESYDKTCLEGNFVTDMEYIKLVVKKDGTVNLVLSNGEVKLNSKEKKS